MTTTHETPTKTPTKPATNPATTTERDWIDQYLTFVKRIEAPVVRTTARMATRFAEYVPERPAFLASMPKVHELVDTGITFRKRVVDEQTRFARQMVKAMDPMLVRVDAVHPEPTGTVQTRGPVRRPERTSKAHAS